MLTSASVTAQIPAADIARASVGEPPVLAPAPHDLCELVTEACAWAESAVAEKGLVLVREADQLVGHAHPLLSKDKRARVLALFRRLEERLAHVDDLAQLGAAFDGDRDRQVPHVVRKELENRHA